MANTLTNILEKILAAGLMTLRERAVMPRLTNSSFSTEAAEKGTTIDIPLPVAVAVSDVTPAAVPPTPGDTTPGLVQLSLDKWRKSNPFHLTDREIVEIDRNQHFIPMQVAESVKALANDTNISIHASYRSADTGIFGYTGTAGTTPFGSGVEVASATQARKLLNQQLAPLEDRRGVVNFDAEAAMLELAAFRDASQSSESDVVLRGQIGQKYGIDWVADDHVATHTAGTLSDGSNHRALVDNVAGYAVGTQIIDVDSTTLTGTIVNGDILQFAGHSQTYVVVDNTASAEFAGGPLGTYTAASNAITGLKFYPPLVSAIVDNEQIDFEDTHVLNLIFHRDAIAYATRPLVENTVGELALGSQIASMQDPVTGLILRLEVLREYKQTAWEFDILWGTQLIRPELAVRLAG